MDIVILIISIVLLVVSLGCLWAIYTLFGRISKLSDDGKTEKLVGVPGVKKFIQSVQ